MRIFAVAVCFIAPALGAAPSAGAQTIPVDSGQPVRVALRAGPWAEGVLIRQTPEHLVIRVAAGDAGTYATFLMRDVETVETPVYNRSGRSSLIGLMLGIFGGAAVGGVIDAASSGHCTDACGISSLAVPAFALLGGFVGLMAGSSRITTEWNPVWPTATTSP